MEDEDFVETSDVEELAEELEKEEQYLRLSSPRRSISPSIEETKLPRKRMKVSI